MAESTLQIQPARGPGRPFEKGQSGNPAGKPPGCRNHASRAAELLLDGEAEALTRKAVALALDGDPTAMRLCLERIVAPRRARTVQFDLPPIADPADIAAAMTAITRAVADVPSRRARRPRSQRSSTHWFGRSRPATSTDG